MSTTDQRNQDRGEDITFEEHCLRLRSQRRSLLVPPYQDTISVAIPKALRGVSGGPLRRCLSLLQSNERSRTLLYKKPEPFSSHEERHLELSNIIAELQTERQLIDKVIAALEGLNGDKRLTGRRARRIQVHWTQRPENKAKVQRIIRAAQKARAR